MNGETAAVLLPTERRVHQRFGMTMPALIQLGDGIPLRPCTVLDVSLGGGRIRLDTGGAVPDHFILLFTKAGTVRRDCRVVWRQENYLGVAFAGKFDQFRD